MQPLRPEDNTYAHIPTNRRRYITNTHEGGFEGLKEIVTLCR